MILGLSLSAFTLLHVSISLLGILTGLVVVAGMFRAKPLPAWTALFLITTILTSATGFLFPVAGIDPPKVVGTISLVVLAVALFALYGKHLSGSWRWIYVVTAVTALYFNVFVLVVQAFQKIVFLKALAPRQNEPPFAIAQVLVLVVFIALGWLAVKKFHPSMVAKTA